MIQQMHLKTTLQKKLSYLTNITEEELTKQEIPLTTGKAKIKKIADSFKGEWVGANKNVFLEPTSHPLIDQLKIRAGIATA